MRNKSSKSCLQVFHKTSVLENLAKFTRQHLCWGSFLIKLEASRTGVPNFAKSLRIHFS